MSNKTYAVVHKKSGIVFAKKFVRTYNELPKIVNAKVAIIDINKGYSYKEKCKIIYVYLSLSKEHLSEIKDLAPDTFLITNNNKKITNVDYFFYCKNGDELIKKLGCQ